MQIQLSDLYNLPGAPFAAAHVDAVAAKFERLLGWHVAPSKTETVEVRVPVVTRHLILPSRYVTAVNAVRYAGGGEVTGWELTSKRGAMLEGTWYPGTYEIDLVHGYEKVPADLLAEIARACVEFRTDPTLASWSSGPFSASLRAPGQGSGPSATFYAYTAETVI